MQPNLSQQQVTTFWSCFLPQVALPPAPPSHPLKSSTLARMVLILDAGSQFQHDNKG